MELNLQYTFLDDDGVKFSIFDVFGRELRLFIDEVKQERYYNSVIELSNFESGLYLYTFTFNVTKKT